MSFFDGNESYGVEEAKIEDEFETLFPDQNIIFISEGSLTEIKNSNFELGYDNIIFDYPDSNVEFEVYESLGLVEESGHSADEHKYALAA